MKKIAVFIGTRPEAIKMAPVIKELEASSTLEPVVVSTGQHREMLKQVVKIFNLPVHHELEVMMPNQTLASLSSLLLSKIDSFLETELPDFALVQGDTTTVLMASLACFYRNIPVGHLEAGLRTGNMLSPFPEEANRKCVTPLASLHFAPTITSRQNLLNEGVKDNIIHVTGNTVIDALRMEVEKQKDVMVNSEIHATLSDELGQNWQKFDYVLITGHRRENFGVGFAQICDAVVELASMHTEMRFIYPVHLNPNVKELVEERLSSLENVILLNPQSYRPFVALMNHAKLILTDSGGVQEEAPSLGKPVLVMRDTTERPEGLKAGTVKLVGADKEAILNGVNELLTNYQLYLEMSQASNPYGDGHAAKRVVSVVDNYFFETG
jgi:UDP-N-acetylglucosamine 2-epimerase (non-hydrolysing)